MKSSILINYDFKNSKIQKFGLMDLDSTLLYNLSFCLQELGFWACILCFGTRTCKWTYYCAWNKDINQRNTWKEGKMIKILNIKQENKWELDFLLLEGCHSSKLEHELHFTPLYICKLKYSSRYYTLNTNEILAKWKSDEYNIRY